MPAQSNPMAENQDKHEDHSLRKALQEKAISKTGLSVLLIVLMIIASIVIWQLDVDWERHVQKHGYVGVFVLMLVSGMTIFFPLPSEAVLAVAPNLMELEAIGDISKLGLVASLGAALGELTAYFAGLWGRTVIADKYKNTYNKVEGWMRKYGGPAIFAFSFTPLPFDLVGIVAGSIRFPIWKFLFYCWVGRLARALLIVHLGKIGWDVFFG